MQGQNYNPYTGVQILEGKIKMDANGIKLKD